MILNKNTVPVRWESDSPGAEFAEFCATHREEIDAILLKHGAILFKGFEINSTKKLNECVEALPGRRMAYVDGNSPRTKLNEAVYTSTEHPAELFISLHSELSYTTNWPARLYFCCEVAPEKGGSTLIADNRKILAALKKDIVDEFTRKGVKYVRNLHGGTGVTLGNSWQKTFETVDPQKVEAHCLQHDIEFFWKDDGGLRVVQNRAAIARHPQTGEEVWFNQADQFHPSTNPPDVYEAMTELFSNPFDMPQYACFGDNSPIREDVLDSIREITAEQTIYFPWEVGDLLMVDNMLFSHGRSSFTGNRRILVAMSE